MVTHMIIGISGTNGSGKDTIGELLSEKYGFLFISVSDLLRDEAMKREHKVERKILRDISAEWRRDYGYGVLVEKALDKFNESEPFQYKGLAIASLRNPGEADKVHQLGGKVIWADADPEIRYERIQKSSRDGRHHEDNKTFDEFVREEEEEMQHSGDLATLNMYGVRSRADLHIENNGQNVPGFKTDISITLEAKLGLKPIN